MHLLPWRLGHEPITWALIESIEEKAAHRCFSQVKRGRQRGRGGAFLHRYRRPCCCIAWWPVLWRMLFFFLSFFSYIRLLLRFLNVSDAPCNVVTANTCLLQFPYLIEAKWKKKHFMCGKVFITYWMQHICQGLKDGSNSKSQYQKARQPARTDWQIPSSMHADTQC